ncbi:hypothetical protein [Hyalangium minutum]|uniref:Uncharacterized protein n=1 Tax=Hyalangium minutum TaxID=394096 RepID=A0A085WRB0_9BACT|nr:hypothetical protein [Hyalangium minutum]KFE70223.1 hypothetical protein DB31_5265 [Hyalangium minutum]
MSEDAAWQPYEGGSTLGMQGSQGGTITWDEAYAEQLRLTLEQDESRSFHAITCGVSGWMVHTRFFGSATEAIAAFEEMRPALVELLSKLPPSEPKPPREALREGGALLSGFIARFP